MDPSAIASYGLRDPVAAGSHLLACAWALFTTLLLWRMTAGDRLRRVSVACFGVSMVLLYGASGLYHSLTLPAQQLHWFRLFDHSCIYVLIAGTYTPIFAILLRGRMRIVCLSAVWLLAAVGIACKWLLPLPPYGLTVGLYLAVGWNGVVALRPLLRALGTRGMAWGLAGGLFYTAGGIADALHWPVLWPHIVGSHELVHMFDIGGTLTHVILVVRYILPFER
jgi:hemolysin III